MQSAGHPRSWRRFDAAVRPVPSDGDGQTIAEHAIALTVVVIAVLSAVALLSSTVAATLGRVVACLSS